MSTVAEKLLTAEEFAQMPDPGHPTELVRGRIIEMPPPGFPHGVYCSKIDRLIGNFVDANRLGRTLTNDSGVITERGPDSVRGPDFSFYSYDRVPKGSLRQGYPTVSPEMVFEVLSPEDRWSKVMIKVGEFLEAGVLLVCVLDPKKDLIHLYRPDETPEILGPADEWSAPEILGDFRVPVRRFFECD